MHCYQGYIKPEHTLLNINIFKDQDVLKLRLLLANGFCLPWQMPVQKEIKSFPTLTSFNFSSLLHCFIGLHPLLPTLQICISTGSLQGSDQYLKCSLCSFLYKWLFNFFSFICQISVGCKSTLGRKTPEKYFLKTLFHGFFFKRFLGCFFSHILSWKITCDESDYWEKKIKKLCMRLCIVPVQSLRWEYFPLVLSTYHSWEFCCF